MKIRILDDSIRLRLDRDEVDAIGAGGTVECATRFPGGATFAYSLGAAEGFDATFEDGHLALRVPAEQAERWAADAAAVSLRARLPAGGRELVLLVEKDFECLNPRDGESQANRFRNPAGEET